MPEPHRLPRHPFRPFSAFRRQAAGMAAATLSPNFREGLLFAVQNFAGFVFRSADSVLSLALHLVSLTLGFVLGIAGHLANAFLDFVFDVGSSAFYPILIHFSSPYLGANQQPAEKLPDRS